MLRARWVVDASGVKAVLARANGWLRRNERHPTMSAWARWREVADWDSIDPQESDASWQCGYVGIRGTATNHLAGDGWWAWSIALKGGDTSVGVVMDSRRAAWPGGDGSVGEKLRTFLSGHPAGKALLKDAKLVEGDVHFRRNLPYVSDVQAGDGFVLTGDASAFLDPFYSPGMDWISFTTMGAVRLIRAWRKGEDVGPLIRRHNEDFSTSYRRMFEALYEDKYDYLGDFEFMRLAFRLDIALYYLFVAGTVFRGGAGGFDSPPYAVKQAGPIFALMRLYNRRFAAMARKRRVRGCFGRRNAGQRDLFAGFNFRRGHLWKIVLGALAGWARLECREGWRSWFVTPHPAGETPGAAEGVWPESATA